MIDWSNLQKLLSTRGKKTELSEKTGISTGYISDWFNPDKSAQPSAEALYKIAKCFDCFIDYLIGLTDVKKRGMETSTIYRFPVFYQSAAAGIGDPTHQWSNESDKICFPKKVVPKGITHAIIVDGFSMEPTFFNGQIVFINAEKECSDGDFGIFQVITPEKTDVYCKQLKYDEHGRRYLHSVSERADDPEFIESEETILECIGKIIMTK